MSSSPLNVIGGAAAIVPTVNVWRFQFSLLLMVLLLLSDLYRVTAMSIGRINQCHRESARETVWQVNWPTNQGTLRVHYGGGSLFLFLTLSTTLWTCLLRALQPVSLNPTLELLLPLVPKSMSHLPSLLREPHRILILESQLSSTVLLLLLLLHCCSNLRQLLLKHLI